MPITLYRCAHTAEELNEKFERLFEECDILVVEHAIGEDYKETQKYYNQLSFIGKTEYIGFSPYSDFEEKLESHIKNSGKRIEVERSPLTRKHMEILFNLIDQARRKFLQGDIEEVCEKWVKHAKYLSKLIEIRDKSLAKLLINLEKENMEKNILVVIGADHMVHYELKKKGINVKQIFPYKPFIFSLSIEPCRRIRFNKECPNELIARSFVSTIIGTYLESLGIPYSKTLYKVREISEKLSYEDIKNLSKYVSNPSHREMYREATILWLRKRGFEI